MAGENLLILCLDLFMAGSKTTSDTLATTFLFLSLNLEWLKILQNELDSVVGRSRAPTENDLPFLPMTEAFLAEVTDLNYNITHFFQNIQNINVIKYTYLLTYISYV